MVIETRTQRARGPVRYKEIGRWSRMRDTSWDRESKVVVTEFGEVAKDVEPVLRCSRGFRGLEVTFRAGRFECRVVRRRDTALRDLETMYEKSERRCASIKSSADVDTVIRARPIVLFWPAFQYIPACLALKPLSCVDFRYLLIRTTGKPDNQ